ncbi:histidine phosphatase family protein [Cohnella suwonensis]|uniref:Histidine phosphatase family protein n=1 Tax=Cohnella suwonensis TaxID=696072 RepID=A0ABW0LST6_9BACL
MTMATRMGWIRHGITEWNRLGKIQGVTDIPLSEEGAEQARKLAERLSAEGGHWDGIYCSDLKRARRTAEILAERLDIPLVTDARLRERSFGKAEGMTPEERLAEWGVDWRANVPDQESDEVIRARGHDFVDEFSRRHPGQSWLIVTHGSFLARMLQSLCDDLTDSHLHNMSLTILERQAEDLKNNWKPHLHNCTLHLAAPSVKR